MHTKQDPSRTPGAGGIGNVALKIKAPRGTHFTFLSQNDSTPTPSKDPKNFNDSTVPSETKDIEILPAVDISNCKVIKRVTYNPAFGPLMYEYFSSREKYREVTETFSWKSGEVEEKKKRTPNTPPHFSEFARSIGTTKTTLENWAKNHEDFAEYYNACVDIIQEFYIDNGVTGNYTGQFSIFAAKNTTKMRDVVETHNFTVDMKKVLNAIEKGKDVNSLNHGDF